MVGRLRRATGSRWSNKRLNRDGKFNRRGVQNSAGGLAGIRVGGLQVNGVGGSTGGLGGTLRSIRKLGWVCFLVSLLQFIVYSQRI